jgi:hypothetical protein
VVREDSVLEWAEVGAYLLVALTAAGVVSRTRGVVRLAYLGLFLGALLVIGEELSWGQRLFGITTPPSIAAANNQEELNVHDIGGAETATRAALLIAALYGVVASLVRRPGRFWPLVPPRPLVAAFGVVVVYYAIRFAFLPHPTYVEAKFSEWPEFCFAAAVAIAAGNTLWRLRAPPGALAGGD